MEVVLLRHAPTAGNLMRQYTGHTDEPLAPLGVALAEKLRHSIPAQRVHTSALQRAVQTAELMFPGAHLIRHPGLNEMNFGVFEGRSAEQMAEDADYTAWLETNCEAACPGGEGKDAFIRRTVETFLSILQAEQRQHSETLCIVAHGGTIFSVLSELALPVREYFNWQAEYCGGYRLQTKESGKSTRPLQLVGPIRPDDDMAGAK